MTEATSCLLVLAPTPQLGNKSPPVSCDPCRISSSRACSFSPRRLVRALTRSSRTPHQGQEKCLQSRVRQEERLRGEPARRGAGPGGVLGTSPGDLAQAESRSETARAPSARGAGKRGRRGGTRPGDLTNDRGAKTDRQSPRQTRRQGR